MSLATASAAGRIRLLSMVSMPFVDGLTPSAGFGFSPVDAARHQLLEALGYFRIGRLNI
jgi:hypothetical protein